MEPAAELPVARVLADTGLAHLDRPFDYVVPAALDEAAQPGVRVRVRFAGRLVDGYLLNRVAESDHVGKLSRLERVISPEPVLTPQIAQLARQVADRYGGVMSDVLRMAVPPRSAAAEKKPLAVRRPMTRLPAALADGWLRYVTGAAFVSAVRRRPAGPGGLAGAAG